MTLGITTVAIATGLLLGFALGRRTRRAESFFDYARANGYDGPESEVAKYA